MSQTGIPGVHVGVSKADLAFEAENKSCNTTAITVSALFSTPSEWFTFFLQLNQVDHPGIFHDPEDFITEGPKG